MFTCLSSSSKLFIYMHCTDEAQHAETVLSAVLSITLLLLRAGEIPVFLRQRYRAVQWLHCHLCGKMYPTSGSLQPDFVEHSTWGWLVAGHWAKLATSVV